MNKEGIEELMRWLAQPKTLFGIFIVGLLSLMRLYAFLVPYDPVADVHLDQAFQSMGAAHYLGTDQLGRDLMLRIIHATEAFYVPGLFACGVASVGGVLGGALAGFYGGPFAGAFRYLTALISAFPRFILILLVLSITGEGSYIMAFLTGFIYIPIVGETVYRKVLHFRSTEFIEAAKAHGLKDYWVLAYHILYHNCLSPITRHLIYLFGYVILIETSLSYLGGFGRQEPAPSWGNMVSEGQNYFLQGEFLFVAVPAVAITFTLLGLVALGDAVGQWGDSR